MYIVYINSCSKVTFYNQLIFSNDEFNLTFKNNYHFFCFTFFPNTSYKLISTKYNSNTYRITFYSHFELRIDQFQWFGIHKMKIVINIHPFST